MKAICSDLCKCCAISATLCSISPPLKRLVEQDVRIFVRALDLSAFSSSSFQTPRHPAVKIIRKAKVGVFSLEKLIDSFEVCMPVYLFCNVDGFCFGEVRRCACWHLLDSVGLRVRPVVVL